MQLIRVLIAPFLAIASVLAAPPAGASLNVLACEPEWATLTQALGGDAVRVTSATTARQDPHRIEAKPSLIARARTADLVVCTGAELEVGWLPLLQRESGNPRILPGQPGYFEAARQVRLLERPVSLDRGQGDIHPDESDVQAIAAVVIELVEARRADAGKPRPERRKS